MPLVNHDFNLLKMVTQLLGTPHRKTIRIAWLTACLKGLRMIHDKFLSFSNAKLFEVQFNGQTIVLEKLLQELFGAGITITNNLGSIDGAAVGAGMDWLSSIGEGTDYGGAIGESFIVAEFDFTVNVPSSITFNQSEMEAWIRKYNSNTFNIVIV